MADDANPYERAAGGDGPAAIAERADAAGDGITAAADRIDREAARIAVGDARYDDALEAAMGRDPAPGEHPSPMVRAIPPNPPPQPHDVDQVERSPEAPALAPPAAPPQLW